MFSFELPLREPTLYVMTEKSDQIKKEKVNLLKSGVLNISIKISSFHCMTRDDISVTKNTLIS